MKELENMKRDMERLFHEFSEPRQRFAWPRAVQSGFVPSIDLYDRKGEIVVKVELPGLDKKDIELTITKDTLAIKGEAKRPEEIKDEDYYLAEIVRAEVGQFGALDVAPHELGRVELRRVAGQPLDREPRALGPEVRLHGPTLMRGQPVPDQGNPTPAKLALQVGQELHQGGIIVAARASCKTQPAAPEIPPERHGDGDGELLPVEGVDQDGGFAAGRPRATDRRPLGDATLVLEDDPAAEFSRFFFTADQRVEIHCRTASSFRSLARRAGRCSDQ